METAAILWRLMSYYFQIFYFCSRDFVQHVFLISILVFPKLFSFISFQASQKVKKRNLFLNDFGAIGELVSHFGSCSEYWRCIKRKYGQADISNSQCSQDCVARPFPNHNSEGNYPYFAFTLLGDMVTGLISNAVHTNSKTSYIVSIPLLYSEGNGVSTIRKWTI